MKVSDQLHTSPTYHTGKDPPVLIEYEWMVPRSRSGGCGTVAINFLNSDNKPTVIPCKKAILSIYTLSVCPVSVPVTALLI
jgi:hypothetical protein